MVIGITGSFGSGKTTVAKMFMQLGAYVIDADKICHSLMVPSGKVYKDIVAYFGNSILRRDKTIDRSKLAGIVFKERSKVEVLNKLVHPRAIRQIYRIIRGEKKRKIIVIDAALLIETGLSNRIDRLVVVKTPLQKQIGRLIRNRGISKKDILQRISMQLPLEEKVKSADFVIDNSGTKRRTLSQVKEVWDELN